MSAECEIYEVPLDESPEEESSAPLSPITFLPKKPQKPRHKKVLSEETKAKMRVNIAKARAVRLAGIAKERELRALAEQDVQTREEDESDEDVEEKLILKTKGKRRGPKPKTPPKRSHRHSRYSSEDDESGDSWSEEEPEPPKKTRKRAAKKAPKAPKKVSEKEKRLSLLELKLDEIIAHTKRQMEKPRTRNVKSTTTIIQAPPKATSEVNPEIKKAAMRLMSMF